MSIFKWIFDNIAPGETTASKRVDADRIMDNFETLATGQRSRARGIDAVDGNANGSSTTTQCNITIKTDQGELGLLVLNDWVIVEDANGNVWNLQNTLANDELSFSVTHLISGSTPGDYSDAGFINGLEIMINPGRMVLGKNQLGLLGSHPQKITGSDVETSSADTTKIGTALPAVQTQIDVEHEAGGGHSADIIGVTNIAPDALLYENDANIVRGTMDYDSSEDGRPDGWEDYNTPTLVELSTVQVKQGAFSVKIVGSQPNDGIKNKPSENPIDPDLFKGREIALAAWVYCATNNTVKLEIYDGVDTTPSAAGGAAGSWVRLYVSHTVNAAATEITPRIYVTEATTIYADATILCLGELAAGFTPHVNEVMYARIADASLTNYCPNSQFLEQSSGSSVNPDFWDGTNARGVDGTFQGGTALGIELDLGETFFMDIPNYKEFWGKTVYFTAYIYLNAGANELRMKIDDGVDDSYEDVVPTGSWVRRGVQHAVNAAGTQLRISFENQDAGTIDVKVAAVMLTIDSYSMGYKTATIYKPFERTFGLASSLADGHMEAPGNVTTGIPIPFPGLIQSMFIREGTSGTGTDVFTLFIGGVAKVNYDVALGDGITDNSAGVTMTNAEAVDQGDYIQVYCDADLANPGSNAVAVVKGITWT